MAERKKITKIMAQRYQKAKKKEKGKILDEIVALVGYNCCYASWVLRNYGRKVLVYDNGKRTIFIGERNSCGFINTHLTRYCQETKITFTRTRLYRKNDNCTDMRSYRFLMSQPYFLFDATGVKYIIYF